MKNMEPLTSKAMDDILERARELGGDELVDGIKKAKELEADLGSAIRDAHMKFMDTCEAAGLPEALACASACNVLSHSYATTVALLGTITETGDTDLINSALRSFMSDFEKQSENIAALKAGVGSKITKAAKDFEEKKA